MTRDSDTRRMAETGTGSGRSPSSAGPSGHRPDPSAQSKAEAVRLAKELYAIEFERKYRSGMTAIFTDPELWEATLARYIEANPAISDDDRARARELIDIQATDFIGWTSDALDLVRLLRLIAGPEEVDPLAEALTSLDTITGSWSREDYAGRIRTALHQAGYEITPITKQEGVS